MSDKTKKKIFDNLDTIGSIVMIIALFLGAFYKDDGGAYAVTDVYPGYKLILNTDYLLGSLFIILPAIVLITRYVSSLDKYSRLIKLVCPIITLIFVFVLKNQIVDAIGEITSAKVSFAMGAWIYLLGNIIALIGGAAGFWGINLESEINKVTSNVAEKNEKK